jgi:hypothetical protein
VSIQKISFCPFYYYYELKSVLECDRSIRPLLLAQARSSESPQSHDIRVQVPLPKDNNDSMFSADLTVKIQSMILSRLQDLLPLGTGVDSRATVIDLTGGDDGVEEAGDVIDVSSDDETSL